MYCLPDRLVSGSVNIGVWGLVDVAEGVHRVSGVFECIDDAKEGLRRPCESVVDPSEEKKLVESEGQSPTYPSDGSLSKSVSIWAKTSNGLSSTLLYWRYMKDWDSPLCCWVEVPKLFLLAGLCN